MDPESVRRESFAHLDRLGFRPARWLPLPEPGRNLRPTVEIARRLMALNALFTWASAPESVAPTDLVRADLDRNRLGEELTAAEAAIVELPREQARADHAGRVGWRLENMWPLAWVLGFEPAPDPAAPQVDGAIAGTLIFDFLSNRDQDDLLARATPRSVDEVIRLEDRFSCAHNAVRSAQLGHDTVPEGFDPIAHGGTVHERRHALTWCLAPGVAWEETDLST